MAASVKKVGHGLAVLIPDAIARDMELIEGTPVEVARSGDAILIRKQNRTRPKRRSLAEIVAQIDPEAYRRRTKELRNDGPVGGQIV